MNGKLYILFLMLAFGVAGKADAQLNVDNTVQFISSDSLKNSISGVGDPIEGTNIMNAKNILFNDIIHATCNFSSDTFYLNPGLTDTLIPGSWLVFNACDTSRGPTFFQVSNYPSYPVFDSNGYPMIPGEIVSQQEIICVFTGNSFVLVSNENFKCPPGFRDVNDEYCIQIDEQPIALFWLAVEYCYSLDARLCKWSEWYNACVNSASLGLNNMATNYEFIDDAGDHSSNIVYIGNGGSCTLQNNLTTLGVGTIYEKNYRCCYDKK